MAPSPAQLPVTASDRLLTEHEAASMLGGRERPYSSAAGVGYPRSM
jgi:hypothetical protein